MKRPGAIGRILLALAILAFTAAAVVGLRRSGVPSKLDAALTPTPQDEAWLAALPRLDPALQERAWALMRVEWPQQVVPVRGDHSWYLRGEAPGPGWVERHELRRTCAADMSALLQEDGLCLSSAAWAQVEVNAAPPAYVTPRRMPNLLVCRNAMQWYGVETMLADDPLPALDLTDRLHKALRPVGGVIDHMIYVSLGSMRDLIHARLALRDKLPEARLQRWLAERPDARRGVLDAYRAERLLFQAPLARDVLAGGPRARKALYGDDMDPSEWFDYHWHAEFDLLAIQEGYRLIEDHLEGRVEAAALDVIADWEAEGGRTIQCGMLSHRNMIWNLVHDRARHRIVRLFVQAMRLPGELPADEKALRERVPAAGALLDAGAWDLAVRYQRVGPKHIRLYVPADSPLPAILEGRHEQLQSADETPSRRPGPPPALRVMGCEVEGTRTR